MQKLCTMLGDDYGQQNGSHVDGSSPWLAYIYITCIYVIIVLNINKF